MAEVCRPVFKLQALFPEVDELYLLNKQVYASESNHQKKTFKHQTVNSKDLRLAEMSVDIKYEIVKKGKKVKKSIIRTGNS